MFASRRDARSSSTSGILLKAKRFGIFSVFAITANIFTIPLAAYSQIAVDGSTATEVKGNVISPTGAGTVNGGNLYNSFQEFNVPRSGVIFNTGNSTVDGNKINNIINRVTGENPSSILGTIESRQAYPNANLYLLNPNGVIFSPNARLDIGGSFNVSTGTGLGFNQNQKFTVDKNSLSFPSGDPKNIQFAIAQPAGIINQGNLSVDAGKNITITAGTVINTGNLTAPNGNVSLAAVSGNSQVELRSPDLVLGLSISKDAIPSNWNGAIASLPKLAESLTGKAAEANQVVVKPDGSIALVTVPSSSDIVVKDGMAIASGIINVSSESSKGGNIGIFGNQVGLVNAQVNASGATGGGTVLIGGDFQGKGVAPNALQTYIDASSKILANGLLTGDGGKVIIWADRSTQFLGAIAARGGEISGNGGFVEVSGKENLAYQGDTDTRAINGFTGSLLLDPTDITIGGTFDSGGILTSTFTPSAASSNIQASTIVGQLVSTNVTISTTSAFSAPLGGTITVNSPISWNTNNSLTLQADNNIIVNGNITPTGSGNFTATAVNNITVNAPQLATFAGALTLTATNGNITIPTTNALGSFTTGDVNFTAGNGITLGGTVLSTSGGNITLKSGNGGISSTSTNGINSTFPSGNSRFIAIDTSGILSITNGITSQSFVGNGGNITIGSNLIPTSVNIASINSSGAVNGGDITINGSIALTSFTSFSSTGTSAGGNINLVNSFVTGNQSLTLNAGSGNVTLGAIGTSTTPLVNLLISSANIATFNGVVDAQTVNSSATNTIFNDADITGRIGIGLGNFTVNGNVTFTGNEVVLNGLASGNGNLTIAPFLPSLAIALGGFDTGALDLTALDLLAFNSGTLGSLTIGNKTTQSNISLTGNVSFAQPTTIQSPAGSGTINTSGFDLNNTGGSITLLANQNITTGNITATGNAIAITSNLGAIDTSLGTIETSVSNGNGGAINLQAQGNIKTSTLLSIVSSNGNGGLISLNSTVGSIDTSSGNIDSSVVNGATGNGGDIKLQATGDILTSNIISAAGIGNGGLISLSTTGGSINIPVGIVTSASINRSGGDILFQAAGDITTSVIDSSSLGNGNGGLISLNTTFGSINTSLNFGVGFPSNVVSRSNNGNGGDILFQAAGNITTSDVDSDSFGNGNGGTISLNTSSGSIDSSLGQILSNSITGNGGNILLNAVNGNIGTGTLLNASTNSTSSISTSGSLSINALNITSIGSIDLSAAAGKAGDLTFSGSLPLTTSTTFFTNSGGVSGNINLANANITGNQSLTLNAGTGNISLGAIGTSLVPLTDLTITSGNTTLNNNIFTANALTFNSPVILLGNAALTTTNSAIAFNNTVNGNQALSLNAGTNSIFFTGIVGGVTPLASLAIAPTSTLTSNNNLDITTVGNITTGSITNLGRNIAIISNNGNIDTSAGAIDTTNSAGNGGDVLLQSLGNIAVNSITTESLSGGRGGNISLISLGGSINTSAGSTIGFLNSRSNNGIGGDILLQAAGNITTAVLSTSSGQGSGKISLITSNGSIDTSLGLVQTEIAFGNGNGGEILYRATGNITTEEVLSRIQFPGTGSGGKISFITTGGSINNQGAVYSLSFGTNGGDILYEATGDIKTPSNGVISSGNINGGNITFKTTGGAIDTSLSQVISSGDNGGTAGNILFQATGNITAKDLVASGILGNAGNITLQTTGNVAIAGNVDTGSSSDNAGNIAIAATGLASDINVGFLNSRSFGTNGNGGNISLTATGNIKSSSDISSGSFNGNGGNISLITTGGSIDISSGNLDSSSQNGTGSGGNISTTPLSPINAGNVTLDANNDVNTGNIATDSLSSTGGNVLLRSRSGQIVTGNVNTTGIIGGSVFFDAATAIATGAINSSGTTRAGDVTLDPLGDVVVSSIDASSPLQAGNVSLVSTGGGLRITDLINSSSSSACIGSSICTSGAIAGDISLQTGGVSSFIVGDSSINGSTGTLTTGSNTIQIGTTILVLLGSQFTKGNATSGQISISPGFILAQTSTSTNENSKFIPPTVSEGVVTIDPDESKLLAITEVLKEKVDGYFKEGNLESAFETIEDAYTSELDVFTGKSTKAERSRITIENTQDMLSTVVQQTGDAAVLIYPVLLKDRIEILVIPPSEKGNAFRATSTTLNQESAQAIIAEYRNNLRDVGSNDYLEQSQKLYDWIIRPVEKKLERLKIDTLVFVMDSGLRVSPPAALHDGKQFLIERYAIASIPTLRALRLEQRDRKTTRVLAMGLTESVEGFSALPSVDIEIKTISSEVLNGAAFLNQDFTVNNLQKQRQGGAFNILHLGTHAKFVSDTSKDSFIQFWDSRLKLSEIPQLRFDSPAIDMLALSACQTAVGNNLGISGLAVESGAKSVLASLWEVSDAGTAPLMISFYKAFPDAVNKAQAMRTAQLALLGGKVKIGNGQILGIEGFPNIPLPSGLSDIDLSHPFYWSSFILVGNWL